MEISNGSPGSRWLDHKHVPHASVPSDNGVFWRPALLDEDSSVTREWPVPELSQVPPSSVPGFNHHHPTVGLQDSHELAESPCTVGAAEEQLAEPETADDERDGVGRIRQLGPRFF